jgi:hypothetical protein
MAAYCLDLVAGLVDGDPETAAVLLGHAGSIYERLSLQPEPFERETREEALEAARAQLSTEEFELAYADGQAMTLEQAVAYALEKTGARAIA